MAARIATLWPHIRVTVLAIGHGGDRDSALLASGVEVCRTTVDAISQWAMRRFGHYTALLVPNTPDAQRCLPDLAAAQTQALHAVITAGEADRPDRAVRRWDVAVQIGPGGDEPGLAAATVRLPAPATVLDGWPQPADALRLIESLGASPHFVRRHVSPPAPQAR